MKKIKFNKNPKTLKEQLELLKERGMIVEDENKALFILDKISYYRLSGYWFEYYADFESKKFQDKLTFESAFEIYLFDKELRKLIFSEIEKIEIAIRAKIINFLSNKYNNPFWYSDKGLFKDIKEHSKLMKKIIEDFKRSDELFVKSFKNKYIEQLPPSWIVLEITSFGTLSKLYRILNNNDKRLVANSFGLPEKAFESWLHSIIYVRNVCAHHSRLWNRKLSIAPIILRNKAKDWNLSNGKNSSMFYVIQMINYLMLRVNPKANLKDKLKQLFIKYPDIEKSKMGFFEKWEEENLWK